MASSGENRSASSVLLCLNASPLNYSREKCGRERERVRDKMAFLSFRHSLAMLFEAYSHVRRWDPLNGPQRYLAAVFFQRIISHSLFDCVSTMQKIINKFRNEMRKMQSMMWWRQLIDWFDMRPLTAIIITDRSVTKGMRLCWWRRGCSWTRNIHSVSRLLF